MVEVEITDRMLAWAKKRVDRIEFGGKDLHKFGSEKDRTLTGYVGEVVVMRALNIRRVVDGYDSDLEYHGKRLEVKTVSCKFAPPPHFLCTVNSCEVEGVHKQKADLYVFVRVRVDFKVGWVLGYIPCADFFERGRFVKKGEKVAGITFEKANATVLPISDLTPIGSLKRLVEEKVAEPEPPADPALATVVRAQRQTVAEWIRDYEGALSAESSRSHAHPLPARPRGGGVRPDSRPPDRGSVEGSRPPNGSGPEGVPGERAVEAR